MSLEVLDPGPLTTVQDLGRPGLGRFGIPEGGALDRAALRIANRLAGNGPGAAGLEFTLSAPVLRWRGRRPIEVSIVGDLALQATLRPGDVVEPGVLRARARGYIAVRDGLAVPVVLGGRGTCLGGGFGGFRGRALQRGDRLAVNRPRAGPGRRDGNRVADPRRPAALLADLEITGRDLELGASPLPLRVLVPRGANTRPLLAASWEVAGGDRAAVQLRGPRIEVAPLGASRPVAPGAIQVTGDGYPLLLLRDHPTVGGYPVVAVVIAADLDRAAQLRPGSRVRFRRVGEATAIAALG